MSIRDIFAGQEIFDAVLDVAREVVDAVVE